MVKKRKQLVQSAAPSAASNMFETIWSRRKFDILGKKQKGEGKRIGQVRSRAIDKRKKTLLQEYKVRLKSNEFVDHRFGENDDGMSEDEKAIMRFQRERQARLQKKDKFALLDAQGGDILTHRGAALSTHDDFNEDLPKDDNDEPDELDEEATQKLNFGGGIDKLGGKKERKTKREVMQELIAKSKHFKALKAIQKEEDMDFQEKLDRDFKALQDNSELIPLIRSKKGGDFPIREKEEPDEYDKLMKEMVFEIRAHASDRLKTTEEIAKEERERLEDLEKKRIQRMMDRHDSESENEGSDVDGAKNRKKQRKRGVTSGDDLGENFVLEGEETEEKGWVDEVLRRKKGDGETEDDQTDDAEENDSDENDEVSSDSELVPGVHDISSGDESVSEESDDEKVEELAKRTRADEKAIKTPAMQDELPFIINVPQTLEQFKTLVANRSEAELELVIQRIRTSNAISLAAENRKKMQLFYNVLLLYFSDIESSKPLRLSRINVLTKPLIEMSGETPYFAAVCARDRLVRMQKQLSVKLRTGDGSSCWPSIRTLLLMRLWSLIFPGSDFRHVVITPMLLLLGEYLLRCPITSGRDVAIGLFLCSSALSITRHARRLFPEALNFLLAFLSTGVRERSMARRHCPVFIKELFGTWSLRSKSESSSMTSVEALDFVKTMSTDSAMFDTDTFRVGLLNVALKTLEGFLDIYEDLPSCPELFRPFLPVLLELLQSKDFPDCVKPQLTDVVIHIKNTVVQAEKLRHPLQMRLKKPVPIKQYNPKFEEEFVKGRDYDIDRDRAERKKLQRQLKREAKGAARELRKDNQFLAAVKEKERTQAETERQEKYNKAMAFLEEQEAAAKSGLLGRRKRKRRH